MLPPLFSDHAVLQKAVDVPVWGKAGPGETVSVAWGGVTGSARADAQGNWKVILDLSDPPAGSHDLVVTEGKEAPHMVRDVVAGEVWLCSGQSNMDFRLKEADNGPEAVASSQDPEFRYFRAQRTTSASPLEDCGGQWVVMGLGTAGECSAVGYFFGKQLREKLKTPVGLLYAAWGGTPVESWTSLEALDSVPELKASKDRMMAEEAEFDRAFAEYRQKFAAWEKRYNRADKPAGDAERFLSSEGMDAGMPVELPGRILAEQCPGGGAVWLFRKIEVTTAMVGHGLTLRLGTIGGFDKVYWNGKRVGETSSSSENIGGVRSYWLNGDQLQVGSAILAVRIFNPVSAPELKAGERELLFGTVALEGAWSAKVEYALPALSEEGMRDYPVPAKAPEATPQNRPAHLFNGIISALMPYAIRGVIWYQGENNTGRGYQYRTAFPLMIGDWRSHWGRGDFPFYFCQLANFGPRPQDPTESKWAELREAQTMALQLPETGQAVLIDLGEPADIHPRNKQDVGSRLALIALAETYGGKMEFSGPVFDRMEIKDGKVGIIFKHAEGGLEARPLPDSYRPTSRLPATVPLERHAPEGDVEGFAVCGSDRQWKWASAVIDGDGVTVWSPEVESPVAVRYAWADDPVCNLYNQAGLPAVPFRTDDFPAQTRDSTY